jgi:hypoxia up-regulated 1
LDKLRQETSEWMMDADSSTSEELKAKLRELKEVVSPVLKRKAEAQKRPEYLELLRQALNQTKMLAGVIQDSLEEAMRSESSTSSLLEAMKSASEARASTSSDVPSHTSEASPEAETVTEIDPLAELEEPDLPPAWTATADTSTTPEPVPYLSPYSAEDLEGLLSKYESVAKWLEEKLELQEKLQDWEDPVFEAGELERKAKDLNDALMDIVAKKLVKPRIKKPTVSKAGKSKASKSTSTQTSEVKETTTKEDGEKVWASVEHNEL